MIEHIRTRSPISLRRWLGRRMAAKAGRTSLSPDNPPEVARALMDKAGERIPSAGGVEIRVPVGPAYEVTAETSAGSTEVGVPDQPGADHRITAKSSAGGVSVLPAR